MLDPRIQIYIKNYYEIGLLTDCDVLCPEPGIALVNHKFKCAVVAPSELHPLAAEMWHYDQSGYAVFVLGVHDQVMERGDA